MSAHTRQAAIGYLLIFIAGFLFLLFLLLCTLMLASGTVSFPPDPSTAVSLFQPTLVCLALPGSIGFIGIYLVQHANDERPATSKDLVFRPDQPGREASTTPVSLVGRDHVAQMPADEREASVLPGEDVPLQLTAQEQQLYEQLDAQERYVYEQHLRRLQRRVQRRASRSGLPPDVACRAVTYARGGVGQPRRAERVVDRKPQRRAIIVVQVVLAIVGAFLGVAALHWLAVDLVGPLPADLSGLPYLGAALISMFGGVGLVLMPMKEGARKTALQTLGFSAMGAGMLCIASMA